MDIRAISKNLRVSPQKCRLVLDQIRNQRVSDGLDILRFSNKKAAALVRKTLESAIASAENNRSADVDELEIKAAFADQGRTQRRYRARARGRSANIHRRTSHVTIVLSDGRDEREEF